MRRAGVTEAAIILQTEGLINYTRGHIRIADRQGLEDFACECYPIIKAEFDRVAGRAPDPAPESGPATPRRDADA